MAPKKIERYFRKPKYLRIGPKASPQAKKLMHLICDSNQYDLLRGKLGKLLREKNIKPDMAEAVLTEFVLSSFKRFPNNKYMVDSSADIVITTGKKLDDFHDMTIPGFFVIDTRTNTKIIVRNSRKTVEVSVEKEGKK